MSTHWTRRQFLTHVGAAAAAIQTFEHIDPCCVFAADAKTADKDLFELKQVADGVYAAIAAPRYKVNSNAAVILTNDGVVVVDSHSKPSAAQALYQEIQGITKQPMRKVINTHFHWDHWQGNQVYAAASPNLEIITSERTKDNLTKPDAGVGGLSYIEKQLAAVPKEIEKLKNDIQQASNPEQKARLEANLQQAEAYFEELKHFKPALPTRTVASSVTLNEQGREIQVLVLGRAHTDGDVFIYLPKEKVVATGDALVDWMPFLGDGYPEEWVADVNGPRKVRLYPYYPRPWGGGDQRASGILPRLFNGSHCRREKSGCRRGQPGGDAKRHRGSIGPEIRTGHVQIPAGAVSGPYWAECRNGVQEGGQKSLMLRLVTLHRETL